jgi:DNA-binding Lrp family transcriptional regulator
VVLLTSLLAPSLKRAHVLLQVEPGRTHEAVRFAAGIPCVVDAVATSGPYDVIVTVAATDNADLRRSLDRLRRTPGLAVLRTCRPT